MSRRDRPAGFTFACAVPDKYLIPRPDHDVQRTIAIQIANRGRRRNDMFGGGRPAFDLAAVAVPSKYAIIVRADHDFDEPVSIYIC